MTVMNMIMIILPRDSSLDSELESGAHLTLILIAVGLAFLFTATAVIFYLFPGCRVLRRALFPVDDSDSDSEEIQHSTDRKEVFQPIMTSTPLRKPVLSLPTPPRSPTFFTARHPIPTPPTHTQCANRTHWHASVPSYRRPLPSPPSLPNTSPLPTAHARFASPSMVGWMMRIADDVVGRHPSASPLFDRVATRAEIAFISGHVHVPWAYQVTLMRPPLLPAFRETPERGAENDGRYPLRDNFSSCTVITKNDSPRLTHKPVGLDDHPRNVTAFEDTQKNQRAPF